MGGAIYAIAGGKGGVGRTTTALNLGVALQRKGYRTALVDADIAMTDLDSYVEVDAPASVHDVLAGTASVADAVGEGPAGLTVAAGDPGLDAFAAADDEQIDRVLDPLRAGHDLVIVDTGPGYGPVHRDAFHAAAGVVLVTTPADGAVDGAAKTRRVVDHVDAAVVGVAVSRAGPAQVRAVADRLGVDPLAAIPTDAAVRSEGVVVGADGSAAGAALERLATALAVYHESGTLEAAPDPVGSRTTAPGSDETAAEQGPAADGDGEAEEPDPLAVLFTEEYGSGDGGDRRQSARLAGLRQRAGRLGPRRLFGRFRRTREDSDEGDRAAPPAGQD
ncbi:MinD/ParA family protein [Halobacteriales archaeon Cl-PHB]